MDEANVPTFAQPEPSADFEALLWDLFLRLMDVPGDRSKPRSSMPSAVSAGRSTSTDPRSGRCPRTIPAGSSSPTSTTPNTTGRTPVGLDGSVARGDGRAFLLSDGNSMAMHADASEYFPWIAQRVLAGERVVALGASTNSRRRRRRTRAAIGRLRHAVDGRRPARGVPRGPGVPVASRRRARSGIGLARSWSGRTTRAGLREGDCEVADGANISRPRSTN